MEDGKREIDQHTENSMKLTKCINNNVHLGTGIDRIIFSPSCTADAAWTKDSPFCCAIFSVHFGLCFIFLSVATQTQIKMEEC